MKVVIFSAILLLSIIFSAIIVEEVILRGSTMSVSVKAPIVSSVMWSFDDLRARSLLFRVFVPFTEEYIIWGNISIISSSDGSVKYYSEFTISTTLTGGTDSLVVITLQEPLTVINPQDFFNGLYYMIVNVNVDLKERRILYGGFTWVPKNIEKQGILIVPVSYRFEIRYYDTSSNADFLWDDLTYGVYSPVSDEKLSRLEVSATISGNSFKVSSEVYYNERYLYSEHHTGSSVVFYDVNIKPRTVNHVRVSVYLKDA